MLVIIAVSVLVAPLGAMLVLVWAWQSDTPWREIGYVRPRSWVTTVAGGLIFGAAFKLVMKAMVMPLFGAPPVNQGYHYLAGNAAVIPFALYSLILGAGFGEETFYRGYLFERLGKVLGPSVPAKMAIVLITSGLFSAAHYSMQGLPGVEQAAITGLVFGTIFAVTGSIVPVMIAHAAFDLFAVALIYWNLESNVAHLVFK